MGVVGLSDIGPINRRANCWYALGDTRYAGRGIMRTACGLLVREGFTTLDLHSLYAWAIVLNEASIRILEANGFARFGVQRQAFRFDERFVDIAWYDQLAAEWADRQTA